MPTRTREETIKKCNEIHNFKYDYSLFPDKVVSRALVKIKCPVHGLFEQELGNHINHKHGCKKCTSDKRRKGLDKFIEQSQKIHGNKYDYSKVVYTTTHSRVVIICPIHGDFEQGAKEHCLIGSGCPKCAPNPKIDLKDFIERASKVHEYKYNYSLVEYKGTDIKVNIICPKHGIFKQRPHQHLRGESCIKCSNHISKSETKWLDSFNIPHLKRQHRLEIKDRRFYVDGLDEKTNTVYEFYGDFYHGNPKFFDSLDTNSRNNICFGDLYRKTLEKEKIIKDAGFNLVTIWESDFKGSDFRKKPLDPQQKWVRRYQIMRYYETLDGDEPIEDYRWILNI